MKLFLDNATTPILSNKKINFCKKELSEEDLYKVMKSMSNNKFPKEFYKTFWDGLKYKKFTRHDQVFLMRLRFERYFSHHGRSFPMIEEVSLER